MRSANAGLPVPSGFVLWTATCAAYEANGGHLGEDVVELVQQGVGVRASVGEGGQFAGRPGACGCWCPEGWGAGYGDRGRVLGMDFGGSYAGYGLPGPRSGPSRAVADRVLEGGGGESGFGECCCRCRSRRSRGPDRRRARRGGLAGPCGPAPQDLPARKRRPFPGDPFEQLIEPSRRCSAPGGRRVSTTAAWRVSSTSSARR